MGAGDEVKGSPVLLWNTMEAAESKDFLNAFFLFAEGTDSSSSMDFLRLSPEKKLLLKVMVVRIVALVSLYVWVRFVGRRWEK